MTQNQITGVIGIGAVLLYGLCSAMNRKTVKIDSALSFAMYAAGVFVGGLVAIRGYRDSNSPDSLYLMVLGAAVGVVSLQQGVVKLSALFKRSQR